MVRLNWERRLNLGLILSIGLLWALAWTKVLPWQLVSLLQFGLFALVHGLSRQQRNRELSRLTRDITEVLHGEGALAIDAHEEGAMGILRSELHKMSQRLVEQTEQLRADKVSLAASLADISHQIRTPLTSLSLITERLRGESDAAVRLRLLREQLTHLRQIDWLISALLKLSKLDAGTAVFQDQPVDLRELVHRALEPLLIPLELKEITLEESVATGSGYLGDLAWSSEALTNILKNCLEHTPPGGSIRISGDRTPLFAWLVIEDTGPGINPADLPHLFERFYRGVNASDQSVGIGLALARLIITRQSGTIKAENQPGGGARFLIHLYALPEPADGGKKVLDSAVEI